MKTIPPLPTRRKTQIKAYPVCSLEKVCEIIENKCGKTVHITEKYGKGRNKVIFLPEAIQEFRTIVSYRRRSPMNVNEQKYAGFGHFLKDEEGNMIIIVKHFLEIMTMNRTPVSASNLGPNGEHNPGLDFLEYYREEFFQFEGKYNKDAYGFLVDPFMDMCGRSEFVLEGHTHPDLGVFYSYTDKETGKARAAKTPVCNFVCDPVRGEMLACVGKNFEATEVIVYDRMPELKGENNSECKLTHTAGEIAHLTNKCLRSEACSGNIRLKARFDGKIDIRIRLVVPKKREDE